ncbi:MAG: RNA polymerase sigma-54 factor [Rhodobacterales bacterium 12-64-8]|nr:MAG: RNA polymerase sigma-54 factor [Rhodobacterales bacterium 12-64-8]OYX46069.1 MAG: RNA polymerase sigma-54 factor [Alphaproteobacteria bacterium 32-64-14]
MALAHRLQLRQGQSLVMTPQLQQAIKLLQLSNVELAEYVETEIERNPLLMRAENESAPEAEAPERITEKREEMRLDESDGANKASRELDARSDDVYENDSPSEGPEGSASSGPSAQLDWSKAGSGKQRSEDFDLESITAEEKSLHDHLDDQLAIAGLNDADRLIASRLIEETDEAGFMRGDLQEIADQLGTEIEDVEAVLQTCQGFEPTGVMARNLQECLSLQLRERDRFDPVMQKLIANLEVAARRDFKRLSEICGVDQEDVIDMLAELRTLTPRPGAAFAGDAAPAVTPDVFVRELPNGTYAVELNADTLPRVLLDRGYYAEVSGLSRKEEDKAFISECQASANWLIKSLDQRARTILKVSSEIVRQQDGFFVNGVRALRPLNLKTVADAVEMHESTVSRVTSNKYVSTPRGVFELKYFFSASIPATQGGESHSAESVRHRIKEMIDQESRDAVLSDDQIVERLRAHGIDIARRTVAKYRESLRIPSSVERRRIFATGG